LSRSRGGRDFRPPSTTSAGSVESTPRPPARTSESCVFTRFPGSFSTLSAFVVTGLGGTATAPAPGALPRFSTLSGGRDTRTPQDVPSKSCVRCLELRSGPVSSSPASRSTRRRTPAVRTVPSEGVATPVVDLIPTGGPRSLPTQGESYPSLRPDFRGRRLSLPTLIESRLRRRQSGSRARILFDGLLPTLASVGCQTSAVS